MITVIKEENRYKLECKLANLTTYVCTSKYDIHARAEALFTQSEKKRKGLGQFRIKTNKVKITWSGDVFNGKWQAHSHAGKLVKESQCVADLLIF